jgi:hypothetical protein
MSGKNCLLGETNSQPHRRLEPTVFSNSGMSLKRGDLGGWGVRVDRVEKREV